MRGNVHAVRHEPWNKGKIVGQKAPFKLTWPPRSDARNPIDPAAHPQKGSQAGFSTSAFARGPTLNA